MTIRHVNQRDMKLDFMRALGTLTIILPHVLAPDIMIQLRTFDVVMLVFVSGMSYAYQSMAGDTPDYWLYVKKRLKKLLLPTFILIFIVFFSMNAVSLALSKGLYFNISDLCSSLLLFEDGIGYVWIIKVYIGMAIVAPFVWKVINRLDNDVLFFGLCGLIYLIYRCIWGVTQLGSIPVISTILEEYVFYILSYMIPFAVGMYLYAHKGRKTIKLLFIFLFIIVQALVVTQGGGFEPNLHKYPPGIYYLTYGIACSLIIYQVAPVKINKPIMWLSKNSLSFYLTHVFWVISLSAMANSLHIEIISIFWIKFIIVVILTTVTVLVMDKIKICYKRYKRI